MLESVERIEKEYGRIILVFEWFFTILFTIEYALRIYAIKKPVKYIFSFMGIVDFLAIIPTYLMFIYPPIHFLVDVRVIRLIRVFRIFKLSRYLRGAHIMQIALRSSRPKIIVFLLQGGKTFGLTTCDPKLTIFSNETIVFMVLKLRGGEPSEKYTRDLGPR